MLSGTQTALPGQSALTPLRLSPTLLLGIVAVHAALLASLLHQTSAPAPIVLPQPLTLRLIVPDVSKPTPLEPEPQPVKKIAPTPRKPVVTPKPVLAVAQSVPVASPVKVVAPAPVVETPVLADEPVVVPSPPTPAPPAPMVQPKFNADYLDNPKPNIDADALQARMADATRQTPQREIQPRAGGGLAYRKVAGVMADAVAAGLSKLGFVTEPHPAH